MDDVPGNNGIKDIISYRDYGSRPQEYRAELKIVSRNITEGNILFNILYIF